MGSNLSEVVNTMTRPPTDEESDSAPEDIAFHEAKEEALEQIKTVSEAIKEKKKIRKEHNKRKQDLLEEQRKKKKQKLDELEARKLPTDVLNSLTDRASEGYDEEAVVKEVDKD